MSAKFSWWILIVGILHQVIPACVGQEPVWDGMPMGDGQVSTAIPLPIRVSADPRRQLFINEVNGKIGRLQAQKGVKRNIREYFVFGVAQTDLRAGKQEVYFAKQNGQLATAELLVDYVLSAPNLTIRHWHVFSRHRTEPEAEEALADLHYQYEQAVAYHTSYELERSARAIRCPACRNHSHYRKIRAR